MARLGRAQHFKPKFRKPPYFPPYFLRITGVITLGGSVQSGVTVYIIDETTGLLFGTTTTNASGVYLFTSGLISDHTYHVAAEYTSGGTKYNAKSLPYLVPIQ